MKLILATLAIVALSSTAYGKGACPRKGHKKISCEKVEGHKRDSFCWKGKVSKKKMQKICKKTAKMKKTKTNEKKS